MEVSVRQALIVLVLLLKIGLYFTVISSNGIRKLPMACKMRMICSEIQ